MSSERAVRVVRIGPVARHPNADKLSVTRIHGGYPVILKTGDFSEGDLAIYVPVDSVVPGDDPRWAFLRGSNRIRAKKLRGVFSMGLLTPIEPGMIEGEEVGERLRIVHYEPVSDNPAEDEPRQIGLPTYTDIEPLRRWSEVLSPDEEVIITEKIHGTNARFVWAEDRLWCGSRTRWKREHPKSPWWSVASTHDLAGLLAARPGLMLFGEVYGRVQDLRYGKDDGFALAVFDALDVGRGRFLDYSDFEAAAAEMALPAAPVLYRGPWKGAPEHLAEGLTLVGGGAHVREGFVVRPARERFDDRVGRVILKLHGEGYLTR